MEKQKHGTKKFWTVTEVVEIFRIDKGFLDNLEKEDLLCPVCREDSNAKLFSVNELEKLHLIKLLSEDMDVNLPGIEIILRMRQSMFEMRRQFDAILKDLAENLRETIKKDSPFTS